MWAASQGNSAGSAPGPAPLEEGADKALLLLGEPNRTAEGRKAPGQHLAPSLVQRVFTKKSTTFIAIKNQTAAKAEAPVGKASLTVFY